mmetsp:Transcript_2631/g.2939  ORF Transcript_2631/g.2939 Transcript_2631/m.2939 type:complete len:254 (+) Transcript_2631:183-944(+)
MYRLLVLLAISLLTGSVIAANKKPKLGACMSPKHTLCADFDNMDNMAWFYDWSGAQIWGKNVVLSDTTILQQASYLIGFNEPSHQKQSNVSPEEAAHLWKQLEAYAVQYNLKLVSPCVANFNAAAPALWFEEWFSNCTELYGNAGCHVDFMCTHAYYNPGGANTMMTMIDKLYKKYGKQVWITEFACPPWNDCTAANNLKFMKEILPKLDASSAVFRYSWFSSRCGEQGGCGLLNYTSSQLTELGEWYNTYAG